MGVNSLSPTHAPSLPRGTRCRPLGIGFSSRNPPDGVARISTRLQALLVCPERATSHASVPQRSPLTAGGEVAQALRQREAGTSRVAGAVHRAPAGVGCGEPKG